jgi:hypothetical protein
LSARFSYGLFVVFEYVFKVQLPTFDGEPEVAPMGEDIRFKAIPAGRRMGA